MSTKPLGKAQLLQQLAQLKQQVAELEAKTAHSQTTEGYLPERIDTFHTLFEASTEAILLETLEGRILNCNRSACRMFGYSQQEFLNLSISDLLPPDVKIQLPDFFTQARKTGGLFIKSKNIRKNGEVFPVEVSTQILTTCDNLIAVTHVRDITDQENASHALDHRMQELIAIYNTSLEIMAENDLNELLQVIVKRAVDLVEAPMGGLYLVQPDGKTLKLVVSYRLPQDFTGTTLQLGEGLSGRIAQTGEMIIVQDYQTWAGKAEVYSTSSFRHVIGIPLKIYDEVIGVINITDVQEKAPYSEQQIQLINLFANQAAVAIHKAQLLEATKNALAVQRQTEKVKEALYRISEATQTAEDLDALFHLIHQVVGELMAARSFYIALYDADLDLISYPYYVDEFDSPPPTARPVHGLTEYVLQKGQPILVTPAVYQELITTGQVEAIGAQPVDWLGVPLTIQKQQIGMMAVQTYSPLERYTQNDREVLAFVSTQAAMAIERKRTDEALRHSAERYRLLFYNAPVGFLLINAQGMILEVNLSAIQILGSPSIEATKAINVLNFTPVVEVGFAGNVLKCFDTGEMVTAECFYTSKWLKQIHIHYYLAPIKDANQKIILVQAILEDITLRKETENEIQRLNLDLRHQANNLSVLNQASQFMASTLDLGSLYQLIAQQASQLLDLKTVIVIRTPQEPSTDGAHPNPSEQLIIAGCTGVKTEEWLGVQLSSQSGILNWVIDHKQSCQITNTLDDPRFHEFSHEIAGIPLQSVIAVPIIARDKMLGIVMAINKLPAGFLWHDQELLEAMCNSAAIALDNARLLTETKKRAVQLSLLYDAGITLNRTMDSGIQIEALSHIAMQALSAYNCIFFQYDGIRGEIYYKFGLGRGTDLKVMNQLHFKIGEERGLIGWIAQSRKPFYLPNVTKDSRWIVTDPEIRSAFWIPIHSEGNLLGLLSVTSNRLDAFSPDDQHLLDLFANQVAIALDKQLLYEAEREQRKFAETLRKISTILTSSLDTETVLDLIFEYVNQVIPSDASSILLAENQTRRLVRKFGFDRFNSSDNLDPISPMDHHLFTQMAKTREILVISDTNRDPMWIISADYEWQRSYIGAPICSRHTVLGFINLYSTTPGIFQPIHGVQLRAFADQAAIALDNAHLYQSAIEAGERRTALHWLSQEIIRASLDQEHIYNAIYQAALKLMPADVFVICLLDHSGERINPVFCVEKGNRFTGLQLNRGEGLSGYIIQSGRSLISSDSNLQDVGVSPVHFGSATSVHSILAVPMRLGDQILGMLSSQCYQSHDYTTEDANLLEILASSAAIALQNTQIFNQMQTTHHELVEAYEATIEGWSRALEMRDKETKGHSDRVTRIALRFATRLGYSEDELVHFRRGVILHDIGKMAIPDHILLKPSSLTADEWQVMRQHPYYAYRMLSVIPFLEPALKIPYCHHENWDGSGYPQGLKGTDIPLGARIFALVDVWDALSADRPYRLAWAHSAARSYIIQQSGIRFDPELVLQFLELLDSGQFTLAKE